MGSHLQSPAWHRRRGLAQERRALLSRLPDRHADRRAAGRRTDRDHRDAAAAHLRPRPDRRADHAGRHLLRRPVRRLDDGDPRQHSRRGDRRRHGARRPPDGQAGPRRHRARHRGDRLVHRRHRRDDHHRRGGEAADDARAAVRPGRLLLADGARPDVRRRAGARIGAEGDRHDPRRHPAVDRRHRPRDRRGAPDVRLDGDRRRHRLRGHRHGPVRLRRDPAQPRAHGGARRRQRQDRPPAAEHGGLQDVAAADPARHGDRLAARHPAGQRRGARTLRVLHASRRSSRPIRRASATAPSKAWPGPNRPTTPAPRPRSFRC